jgi:hypothetical protein
MVVFLSEKRRFSRTEIGNCELVLLVDQHVPALARQATAQ